MNSVKHTPGPWKVSRRFDIVQDLGNIGGYYVGSTRGNSPDLPSSVQLQDEANARLMADSPKLLEACLAVLEFSENPTLEPGLPAELVSKLKDAVRNQLPGTQPAENS